MLSIFVFDVVAHPMSLWREIPQIFAIVFFLHYLWIHCDKSSLLCALMCARMRF